MDQTAPRSIARRRFLRTAAGTTAGMASWLALNRAPAFAQKRELTFLSWNHFVPASDEELRKQAEAFSKANNCTVRIDTIAHLQLPAKYAAEAQSQSGHDMILTREADPFLYENQLADVGDIIGDIDLFVITSGANVRQVKTIAEEVEHQLKQVGVAPTQVEGISDATWILMDYGCFIVHVFFIYNSA